MYKALQRGASWMFCCVAEIAMSMLQKHKKRKQTFRSKTYSQKRKKKTTKRDLNQVPPAPNKLHV